MNNPRVLAHPLSVLSEVHGEGAMADDSAMIVSADAAGPLFPQAVGNWRCCLEGKWCDDLSVFVTAKSVEKVLMQGVRPPPSNREAPSLKEVVQRGNRNNIFPL